MKGLLHTVMHAGPVHGIITSPGVLPPTHFCCGGTSGVMKDSAGSSA
jgi:hypothetical protein